MLLSRVNVGMPVAGWFGPRTRAAIRSFQASAGLPEDGRAGLRVYEALKAAPAK